MRTSPILLTCVLASTAWGQEPPTAQAEENVRRAPVASWAVLELRGGVQGNGSVVSPTLCAEVGPWRYLAIEACGSGAGFLYDRPVDEMVHVRLEGSIPAFADGRTALWVQPGVGIAEIERGGDAPGFRFGEPTEPDPTEGAGVEGSLALKARVYPHPKMYVVGEAVVGVAGIAAASEVLDQRSDAVPFAGLSVGLGF